eukprot:TRINITY_DN6521_c0_g1_i1.p1 TRINITY_DN6521_c0_g1~~TRINITY_DN6521_c0_g1_i1.p1  ORF type:complete len:574 (+),score=139.59 TRINITY_DN6521_c0_g1_i1:134-1723(+)
MALSVRMRLRLLFSAAALAIIAALYARLGRRRQRALTANSSGAAGSQRVTGPKPEQPREGEEAPAPVAVAPAEPPVRPEADGPRPGGEEAAPAIGAEPPAAASPAPEQPVEPVAASEPEPPKPAAVPDVGRPLKDKLTILLSTSPVGRHPATDLIEEVIGSMSLAKGIEDCRLIIVCDGCRTENGNGVVFTEPNYRQGVVDSKSFADYQEYKKRLHTLAAKSSRMEVLELQERNGFGFAVKEALKHVKTQFVFVMQHDRSIMKPVDIPRLVAAMEANLDRFKYIGLPTSTTIGHQYHVLSKYNIRIEPVTADDDGLQFLPLIQWYDSAHICQVEYYRNFVFGPRKLVAKGGFIEDKLGQAQLAAIRKDGVEAAHPEFGTFIAVGPPSEFGERVVGHLDGRDCNNASKFMFAGSAASAPPPEGRPASSSPEAAPKADEPQHEAAAAASAAPPTAQTEADAAPAAAAAAPAAAAAAAPAATAAPAAAAAAAPAAEPVAAPGANGQAPNGKKQGSGQTSGGKNHRRRRKGSK